MGYFINWEPGRPKNRGDCMMLDINTGYWVDHNCGTKANFVCKFFNTSLFEE